MTRALADGIRLFATALVISVVTHVPVPVAVTIIGAAMIVYTVRGGVSAVIWTDVIQLFVYIAGAAVVFVSLLALIPGGWSEVVRTGVEAGKFRVFDPSTVLRHPIHVLGRRHRRRGADAGHAWDRPVPRAAPSGGAFVEGGRARAHPQRIPGLRAVRALSRHRSDAVHLLPARAAAALARNDELLPTFIVTALSHGAAGFIVAAIVAAALSPSLNAMAATTVNDFYVKYVRPDADEPTLMRVSRTWTIIWGVVQILVALGAQGMQRSVLDAGLAVLSFASGSVLGAFLLGTLAPSVDEGATFAGMLAGLVS